MGSSQHPKGDPSHDSSHLWGQKLPTPPQAPQDKISENPEVPWMDSPQTAFKEAMGSAHSSMSWHDQVIEEIEQGGAVMEEEPEFGSNLNSDAPLLGSEGGTTSDVWMVDDGLTQCDSDIVVEEE